MVGKKIRFGLLVLCALVGSFSVEARVRRPLFQSPFERPIQKVPYRPQWVSVVKKGQLFKYKRKEFSSPGVYDDHIFVGADSGIFYSLKKKRGGKAWQFKTVGSVNSAPAFWNQQVFFGDDDGILYAVSVETGKEIWRKELGSEILTAPTVFGDRLFVATVEGKIAALAAGDGTILWEKDLVSNLESFKMTIRGNSPPIVDEEGKRLFVGFADGTLQSFATADGKLLWEKSFKKTSGFNDIDGAPVIDGQRLYIATFDGGVFALSQKNGELLWSQEIGSGVRMAVEGERLYLSGSNGRLYALNKADGSKLWEQKIGSGALTAPAVYQNLVIVGLSDQTINFLSAQDGHPISRRFARKGISSNPLIDGDRIYYLSNGGRLYSLRFK